MVNDFLWKGCAERDERRIPENGWLDQSVAPSDALRHWFGHDPVKWQEFRRRYKAEL